jgi:hypothetical protein
VSTPPDCAIPLPTITPHTSHITAHPHLPRLAPISLLLPFKNALELNLENNLKLKTIFNNENNRDKSEKVKGGEERE